MRSTDQRERYLNSLVEQERQHREALNREVDRLRNLTPVGIRTLYGTYPPLRRLLGILAEAAQAQDPLKGRAIDGSSPVSTVKGGGSREEGLSTRGDRSRVRTWGNRLEGITASFEQEIGGAPLEDDTPARPMCYRKTCKGRGRHQPWGATECKWCGREF